MVGTANKAEREIFNKTPMQDIHTHLYWSSYDEDCDAVVARARAAGVREMLVIGCTVEESRQAIVVAEKYEGVFAAVGIHPHFFNEFVLLCHSREGGNPENKEKTGSRVKPGMTEIGEYVQKLKELAKHKKVVAIGECGLDYYSHPSANNNQQKADNKQRLTISEEQKTVQKAGLVAQMALAQELTLPLILHCRTDQGKSDAYEDMFEILQTHASRIPHPGACILHCYMGDTQVTEKFLTLPHVFFSFTGNITYPVKKAMVGTKDDLNKTVKLIPLERLFVETDCPFLAPQTHRGERNEPSFVGEILARVAELQGIEVAVVEQATETNFQKVFSRV